MSCTKNYTKIDVIKILQDSEGRKSPVSGEGGHTLAQHVNIAKHHLTDRLTGTLPDISDQQYALVTDSTGKLADKKVHRDTWKAADPSLGSKKANAEYRKMVENYKKNAGAFTSINQAGIIGSMLLNSSEGQNQLALLDNKTEKRVAIKGGVAISSSHVWDMWVVDHNDDLPHRILFTKAFLLVDIFTDDIIHIQTLYPVK